MVENYQRLEVEWGKWAGVENVVACNSGSAALHLALEALQLSPGAEVVVPSFAMIACARAVSLAGLTPVFVDCRDDLNLDPDFVDQACSQNGSIRALLPVHTYGRPCDMGALSLLAKKYELVVVEDLAEAHGIAPHKDSAAVAWSFYRNKVVHGEEGGAVAFRDPLCAELASSLRSHGFTPEHDFWHIPRGHNYRLANALALLILNNLGRARANLVERRYLEGLYWMETPKAWRMPSREVPWVYDLRITGMTQPVQDHMVKELNEAGIAARHAFKPLHLQQEYRRCAYHGGDRCTVLSREVIYLPLGEDVAAKERSGEYSPAVIAFEVIRRVLAEARKAVAV